MTLSKPAGTLQRRGAQRLGALTITQEAHIVSDLLYDKFPDDHYAIFTMNRPDRLNAISSSMTEAIHEALEDFVADDEMRVGIVTGTGRAFSAGADLKEMARLSQGHPAF